MSEQALQYWLELSTQRYAVRVVKGEEALSLPFRLELSFTVDADDTFDPSQIVRSEAVVLLVRNGEERRLSGIVGSVRRKATRRGNAGGGEIQMVVEPRLALLRHKIDIRVFREKTVPEIVNEVLAAHEVNVQNRLRARYTRRPYCVQLRESDLDFAHRLLEDEGIFYFIDEAGTVVLGDSPAAYDDVLAVLPFLPGSGMDVHQDCITEMGARGSMTAGSVSLRDFNPVHPSMNMDVSSEGPTQGGAEWYDYPGEYEEPAEGQAKAKLRTEALRCQHHRVSGRSFAGGLRPGLQFGVLGVPEGMTDGTYVITRVTHDWALSEPGVGGGKPLLDDHLSDGKKGFELAFEALPESVTYRPSVVTPAPVLTNPLSGFVTGPAGEDIHTDEWGRAKVHFPWDRLQPKDDNCSHWIPVLQDNTGHSSSIARTRWEVLCHFLEGDPDRPVIMGRVYNGDDNHYSPLPDRKMRIGLRSLSSPRSEDVMQTGENLIQLDDYLGSEGITSHAQRDQNVVVLNEKHEQIDNTDSFNVGGNEDIKIGQDQTILTASNLTPDVGGNQTRTIKGDQSIGVGEGMSENVEGKHTLAITGNHDRQMGLSDNLLVQKNLKETITGTVLEVSKKNNTVMAEKTMRLDVTGDVTEICNGTKTDLAGLGKRQTIGSILFSKSDKIMGTRIEQLRNTRIGSFLAVTAIKELLISGVKGLTQRAGSASFSATTSLTLAVGETELNMKNGRIELNAPQRVVITTSAENKLASSIATQI